MLRRRLKRDFPAVHAGIIRGFRRSGDSPYSILADETRPLIQCLLLLAFNTLNISVSTIAAEMIASSKS
jgi:hypothetical protein